MDGFAINYYNGLYATNGEKDCLVPVPKRGNKNYGLPVVPSL